MTLDAALALSWERLAASAAAHRRLDAEQMLLTMVATQGDDKSWKRQAEMLKKQIHG